MFTTRTPDGEFIALPVQSEDKTIELGFAVSPYIVFDSDEGTCTKVLTMQEINDMIDALNELKRLAGG